MNRTEKIPPKPWIAVMALLRALSTELFDPYRPELHYMRGPGPKWREKHQIAAAPARPGVHIPAVA